MRWLPRRGETGWNNPQCGWSVGGVQRRRERGTCLNQRMVGFQPTRHVDRHCGNKAPLLTVGRDEAMLCDRPLSDDHFIGESRQADRLDVDAELVGPEGGKGLMGPTLRWRT